MASFHLRPVSPSPSPSISGTPTADSPPFSSKTPSGMIASPPSTGSAATRLRRPLSPSSLRDVNLTPDVESAQRKYPPPPTGHELMALFPPAPPASFPEMRPGPTSGYFQRQERAFFAQAGKEIVRVRLEVDTQQDAEKDGKLRDRDNSALRSWPPAGHSQPSQSPAQGPAPSATYSQSRPHRGAQAPVTTTSLYPVPAHGHAVPPPPPGHHATPAHHGSVGMRTPPHDSHSGPPTSKVDFQPEEYRDDPDEAWRRPMPYAERRRAGKHTRRVVVRN